MEFVREVSGVRYINDSKGTNVGAVVKALGAVSGPVVLIAGGVDKGGDYTPLREAAAGKAKLAVLTGEAQARIESALKGAVETVTAASLAEAVEVASRRASPVLLADPWCPIQLKPSFRKSYAVLTKGLFAGTLDAEGQQQFVHFLIYDLCDAYDLSYRPGGEEGRRNSDFAEGKRFIGL